MNLLALKYFIAVAEHRSFTKASEFLYVTQPTLSRQIADLEKEMGTQLLIRNKRSVSLTQAGEVCLSEAKIIVDKCEDLPHKLKSAEESSQKNLVIGFQGAIEDNLLMDSVYSMCDKIPGINLGLKKYTLAELNDQLIKGNLDVIFTVEAGLKKFSDICFKKVADNELMIAVPDSHRFAERDSVMVEELKDEHFIMFERSSTPLTVDHVLKMCINHGFSPSVVYYANDPQSMMLMVSTGKGIAFLSSRLAGKNTPKVRFIKLSNCEVEFNLVLAYRKDNKNPMLLEFLSDFKVC